MKKIKIILIILFFFTNNAKTNINSKILIKIENKIVTNFEVKNKILSSLILGKQEINQLKIEKIKKQTIDLLVLIKLKEIEIEKYKMKEQEISSRLTKYLNEVSSNNLEELKRVFKINGVDYELFKKEIITELLWQKLIYNIYSKKLVIDELAINKEIEKLKQENKQIEEFKLSEIEILLNNDEDDKKNILLIKNEIKNNGFENTAMKFSISRSAKDKGDIGWVNSKSLSKTIYKNIKDLKIGEYSKPIIKPNSLMFLMIKDKRASDNVKFDKVEFKKRIINQRTNELLNLYSQSHLSKLKNTSLIEF